MLRSNQLIPDRGGETASVKKQIIHIKAWTIYLIVWKWNTSI